MTVFIEWIFRNSVSFQWVIFNSKSVGQNIKTHAIVHTTNRNGTFMKKKPISIFFRIKHYRSESISLSTHIICLCVLTTKPSNIKLIKLLLQPISQLLKRRWIISRKISDRANSINWMRKKNIYFIFISIRHFHYFIFINYLINLKSNFIVSSTSRDNVFFSLLLAHTLTLLLL